MDELRRLSELIRERNENGKKTTVLINRPALIGHVGEYIASTLFDIHLEESAVTKSLDGRFRTGELAGRSVNVKWYAKKEGLLDIRQDELPDYYLVLAGPSATVFHSRGEARPWHIDSVHLFLAKDLVATLREKQVRIGTATSVANKLWDEAELYPRQNCTMLLIKEEARRLLGLFSSKECMSADAG